MKISLLMLISILIIISILGYVFMIISKLFSNKNDINDNINEDIIETFIDYDEEFNDI